MIRTGRDLRTNICSVSDAFGAWAAILASRRYICGQSTARTSGHFRKNPILEGWRLTASILPSLWDELPEEDDTTVTERRFNPYTYTQGAKEHVRCDHIKMENFTVKPSPTYGRSMSYVSEVFASVSMPKVTLLMSFLVLCVAFIKIVVGWKSTGGQKEPPSLGGSMIRNTYQYMTDMQGFLKRVS